MKKILVLAVLLLAVSAGTFVIVSKAVDSDRENVEVTERFIYGDKLVAEGISIKSTADYKNRLLWNMSYKLGENPEYDTEYSFYAAEKQAKESARKREFEIYTYIRYGAAFNEPAYEQEGIGRAYKELFDSINPNEKASKVVRIKDYYEYYPLTIMIFEPQILSNEALERAINMFREFFKIPILEGAEVEISVSKGANGLSKSTGMSLLGKNYDISGLSKYAGDKCYFSINNKAYDYDSDEAVLVDMSLVPGGYGLYSYSVDDKEISGLSMVYKLDEMTDVIYIAVNPEQTELLLFTKEEEEKICFNVIDIGTMELKQRIEFDEKKCLEVYEYDGFFVIDFGDRLAVISRESYEYEHKFTVDKMSGDDEETDKLLYGALYGIPNDEAKKTGYVNHYTIRGHFDMDFDGDRLVISGLLYDEDRSLLTLLSFYTAVYDKSGLIYYAEYDNGLSAFPNLYNLYFNCLPYGEDAISVKIY